MIESLLKPEVRQFILDHAADDPVQLMLQAHKFPHLPLKEIVQQIQANKKAVEKLPEWAANPDIIFPPLLSMEQSSSERTAKFKATIISGKKLADLTGGAGVDVFYLSRVFEQVCYVEKDAGLKTLAVHNLTALGAKNVHFHHSDAEGFIKKTPQFFDYIFIDPARRGSKNNKVFKFTDTEPDVLKLLPDLQKKAHKILIKASPMLDIGQALRELQFVEKVYVMAVDNECKEVLYLLNKEQGQEPEILAINLLKEGNEQILSFNRQQEATAEISYSEPLDYIYEPNAAIMKAGAYKTVALQFNITKLHPNTHLYTSAHYIDNFPGRYFQLQSVKKLDKNLPKSIPHKKANITVRNFPLSVAGIRKKTGLREGGDVYLFATTNYMDKPVVLVCRKVDL